MASLSKNKIKSHKRMATESFLVALFWITGVGVAGHTLGKQNPQFVFWSVIALLFSSDFGYRMLKARFAHTEASYLTTIADLVQIKNRLEDQIRAHEEKDIARIAKGRTHNQPEQTWIPS